MLTDGVLILADWLANPTYGVSAGLAAVPLESGVLRASAVTVLDEVRHEEASRLQAPDTLPALVVNSAGTLEQASPASNPFPPSAQLELVVRHIVRDSDSEDGLASLMQGQRALMKCIAALWKTAAGSTAQTRNSIQLYEFRSYRAEVYRPNEDSILTMAHTLTVTMRDLWAQS